LIKREDRWYLLASRSDVTDVSDLHVRRESLFNLERALIDRYAGASVTSL
jgi:hypothetical protein